jgi:copper chaperone CopZ
MTAIHLTAPGLASPWTAITLETALTRLKGVTRVAMVRSAGLVSVLFDERRARAEDIVAALRAAGVEARLYQRVR